MVTKLSSESSEQDNCDKFTKTETSENHTSHDVKLNSHLENFIDVGQDL